MLAVVASFLHEAADRSVHALARALAFCTDRRQGCRHALAATIARLYPGMRGYTRPNLFRMRQFYEAYPGDKKISPLVRQLPWTHHLIILGQAKLPEERLFYMLAAIKGRWTKRELERQIQTGAIVRSNRGAKSVSAALAQTHPAALDELKNAYSLEFLSLRDGHSEADLHGALLRNLGRALTYVIQWPVSHRASC
jgi:predicted nuclease of restriction endonuclease-like (RecB) superfamily